MITSKKGQIDQLIIFIKINYIVVSLVKMQQKIGTA